MYWIASYPRSGNTFFRILLKEVYGVHTWEGYGNESPSKVFDHQEHKNKPKVTFIKTHELPSATEINHEELKAIYLYRDGRDTAVSSAHHRKNIVKPQSCFIFNLRTVILAPLKTSFGGWGRHVDEWSEIAIHKIKFEELIANPQRELEKLTKVIDLPKPDFSKIPSFKDLKTKNYAYGSGHKKLTQKQQESRRKKFFRSGKTGTWKSEIPKDLIDVFHHKNYSQLLKLGYTDVKSSKWVYLKYIQQYCLWFVGLLKEKLTYRKI